MITLPVTKPSLNSNNISKSLNAINLNGDAYAIALEHKRILGIHYKKSQYLDLLESAYSKEIFSNNLLADIVINQTEHIRTLLSIKTETMRSSDIAYKIIDKQEVNSTERKNLNLLNLLKEVEATEYISGIAAQNYLDTNLFERNNIQVKWNSYTPKIENGYLSIMHYLLTVNLTC